MYQTYQQFCKHLQATGKYRQLPEVEHAAYDAALDFSSNDYLGLSRHPALLTAAYQAALSYGVGATGSRLLSGNASIFNRLETRIARDKQMPRALIFNSGFQANFTVLSSLLDPAVLGQKPLVFFDKLNHASLYQALRVNAVELVRYRHLDYAHLEACLARYAGIARPKFIVTETVFGMDGDLLDLDKVLTLAKNHQATLYLDEAHAVGLVGKNGYGLSTMHDLSVPCVVMGTFSKALGASGGYVACDERIADYLLNKAAGFIYSTANSPMVMGAVLQAWDMMPLFNAVRVALFSTAHILRARLQLLGYNTGSSTSPIIPIIDASLFKLSALQQKLAHAGIRVSFVRPPTVPAKAARLRIALNVTHTPAAIDELVRVLAS